MLILYIGEREIELDNFENCTIQDYLATQTRLFGDFISENDWEGNFIGKDVNYPVKIVELKHKFIK